MSRAASALAAPVLAACLLAGGERGVRTGVSGRTCGDSVSVQPDPAVPRAGALFRVRVAGAPEGARLAGHVAGEPLHFARDADSEVLESFAAVPIEHRASLSVEVRCARDGAEDTLVVQVQPDSGRYPVERLTVAPAFGRAPDSALAARIRRESARAVAVARAAHATPRLWTGPFAPPRPSRITSGFGSAREFNGTITSRHLGTDFAGGAGAPVSAVNRGVVRIVDRFYYGGRVVYVDHGAGLTSAYLHLSQQLVAAGDTVERGQRIGAVGATGRVTGPHLHLIVRYGEVTVDPVSLLALAAGPQGAGGR